MTSAHQYPEIHKALGIDLRALGCIMATVEPIGVMKTLQIPRSTPEDDLYYSTDPAKFWINGAVGEQGAHVTLKYGLLKQGPEWQKYVDELLEGIPLKSVKISHVGTFDSPYPDEPYKCIVAHLEITDELREANARLSYLPHVDTFPDYKSHVTLAYVKDDGVVPGIWTTALNARMAGASLKVTGIDYGGDK